MDVGQKDILFIFPPYFRFINHRVSSYPLGLGYMVSYLRDRGISSVIYNADYFDKNWRWRIMMIIEHQVARCTDAWDGFAKRFDDKNDRIWRQIENTITEINPKIVGISASVITLRSVFAVAQIVKKIDPSITVVVGGPEATVQPSVVSANKNVDYIIQGEGEEKMYRLARHVLYGDILDLNVPLISNLDSIPFPDRNALLYHRNDGRLDNLVISDSIIGSRGCPFPCRFCATRSIWGKKPRQRSADNILDEIQNIVTNYNNRDFFFCDDMFSLTKERILEFCQRLHERNLSITWRCFTRLSTIDAELVAAMKAAGCTLVSVGVESGSDRILEHIKKQTTRDFIIEKTAILNQGGLAWSAFIMVGLPTETESDLKETVNLILKTQPSWVVMSVFVPYPGTSLYDEIASNGGINKDRIGDNYYTGANYSAIPDEKYPRLMKQALRFADAYNMSRVRMRKYDTGHPVMDTVIFKMRCVVAWFVRAARKIELTYFFKEIV